MNDNLKIKPCPFCGQKVTLLVDPLWYKMGFTYYDKYQYSIRCSCGCSLRYIKNDTIHYSKEEAINNVISQWNRRADE